MITNPRTRDKVLRAAFDASRFTTMELESDERRLRACLALRISPSAHANVRSALRAVRRELARRTAELPS